MTEMAPIVPRKKWRVRGETVEAQCPWCKQLQTIDEEIDVFGFTGDKWRCRMPQCCFVDYLRLEDWHDE